MRKKTWARGLLLLYILSLCALPARADQWPVAAADICDAAYFLSVGESRALLDESLYATLEGEIVWQSADAGVASVDIDGTLRAFKAGTTVVTAAAGGKQLRLEVRVTQSSGATIEEGLYVVRLAGSEFSLSVDGASKENGANVSVSFYSRKKYQQVQIKQLSENRYEMYPFHYTPARVDMEIGSGAPAPGQNVRIHTTRSSASQYFTISMHPDGSVSFLSFRNPQVALCAAEARDGANVCLAAVDESDPLQRWTLEQLDGASTFDWIPPVERNGKYYVKDGYQKGDHSGVDIGSDEKRIPVLAVADGRVVRTQDKCTHDYGKDLKEWRKTGKEPDPCGSSYGKTVTIKHSSGLTTFYAHLSSIAVSRDQVVEKGQIIGYSGSTGRSSGVHLHFAVQVDDKNVSPYEYVDLPKKRNAKIK